MTSHYQILDKHTIIVSSQVSPFDERWLRLRPSDERWLRNVLSFKKTSLITYYTHSNPIGLLFVCEWIGPGYTSINSGKNAINPYNSVTKYIFFSFVFHIVDKNVLFLHISGLKITQIEIPRNVVDNFGTLQYDVIWRLPV